MVPVCNVMKSESSSVTCAVTQWSACFAGGVSGPKVIVNYTGLLEAPKNVRCEETTGHSAAIVWNKGSLGTDCLETPEL